MTSSTLEVTRVTRMAVAVRAGSPGAKYERGVVYAGVVSAAKLVTLSGR